MAGLVLIGETFELPDTVPVRPFYPIRFQWIGWDGSIWDLSSDRRQGAYLMPGVRGMEMPPPKHYFRRSPARPGAQHNGHTFAERDIYWPLRMWTDASSDVFIRQRRAFMRTLQPGKTGIWRVIQPNGDSRSIRCRFVAFDSVPESDPVEAGWGHYGIRLVAEGTFWYGPNVAQSWGVGDPQEFFVAPPSDDVLFISESSSIAEAKVRNTGDVPAFPRWKVTGPTSNVVLGFGGKLITVPFEVPEGQQLVVETEPGAQSAYLDGVKVTRQLGSSAKFAPVPAGEEVALSLEMSGTGRVSLELSPAFYEAY
jgi:hypothetical protein